MTDTITEHTITCYDCGIDVPLTEAPEDGVHYNCDDCWFQFFGDSLTPNELRRLKLNTENGALRDKYLAEYQQRGIGDDQEPNYFELTVPVLEGETIEDAARRAVGVVETAYSVRMATPDDFDSSL